MQLCQATHQLCSLTDIDMSSALQLPLLKLHEAIVCDKDDDSEGCPGPNNASYYLTYKRGAGSPGRAKVSG